MVLVDSSTARIPLPAHHQAAPTDKDPRSTHISHTSPCRYPTVPTASLDHLEDPGIHAARLQDRIESHVPGAAIFLAVSASSDLYLSRLMVGTWKALAQAHRAVTATARRAMGPTW